MTSRLNQGAAAGMRAFISSRAMVSSLGSSGMTHRLRLAQRGRGMADGRLVQSADRGESWQDLAVTAPIVAMALAA